MSDPDAHDVQTPQEASERAYHHGNLKAALIEAGLAALSEVEPDALSLRQLAKTVGVSPNAAYRHFADKRDLLDAMAAECFRRFAASQHKAVQGLDDPVKRLEASGLAYVDFARTHPAMHRLMFQQLACKATTASTDLVAQSLGAMSVLLEAASALLQAPPQDERVRVLAAACWSLVHGLSNLAMTGQLDVFDMDVAELIRRVVAMSATLQGQATVASP